jgi:hypothetical protein
MEKQKKNKLQKKQKADPKVIKPMDGPQPMPPPPVPPPNKH